MDENRRIHEVLWSSTTKEGAGVVLNRAFGFQEQPMFDPFLLLDDFRSNKKEDYAKGFPWHPHRGIETITYMLSGKVVHQDSLGNSGTIGAGDVQWMTAGSGIIHQEMPEGDGQGTLEGFQFWMNLPASSKMMNPRYQEISHDKIPNLILANGIHITLIAGDMSGIKGPVEDIMTDPELLDITIPPHSSFTHPTKRGHTVFAYIFEGEGRFTPDQEELSNSEESKKDTLVEQHKTYHEGAVIRYTDGTMITVSTEEDSVRFILASGRPLKEPIAWYGPIVMNTSDELRRAFKEYEENRFLQI